MPPSVAVRADPDIPEDALEGRLSVDHFVAFDADVRPHYTSAEEGGLKDISTFFSRCIINVSFPRPMHRKY